jgi:hypothetical protein
MAVFNAMDLDPQLIISKLLAELGEPWLPVHIQAETAQKVLVRKSFTNDFSSF